MFAFLCMGMCGVKGLEGEEVGSCVCCRCFNTICISGYHEEKLIKYIKKLLLPTLQTHVEVQMDPNPFWGVTQSKTFSHGIA